MLQEPFSTAYLAAIVYPTAPLVQAQLLAASALTTNNLLAASASVTVLQTRLDGAFHALLQNTSQTMFVIPALETVLLVLLDLDLARLVLPRSL